jgi:enoyl-CoA hydratase/carnithine racemase
VTGAGAQSDVVTVSIANRIADVQLNRPEKLNALNPALFEALVAVGRSLMVRDDLSAVVITGTGRAFCAGLDFAQFAMMADGAGGSADVLVYTDEALGGAKALGQQAVRVWSAVPVPVIAGIHGVAFGGGLQIALGCDIRVVAPTAELSVMEVQWGLVPDMAGTQLLPELVGRDVAKELTFTGRRVSGTDAVQLGLATQLADDPIAAARQLAAEIARHSPQALRHAKRLLDMAGRTSLEEGLEAEQAAIRDLIGSPVQAEAARTRLARLP